MKRSKVIFSIVFTFFFLSIFLALTMNPASASFSEPVIADHTISNIVRLDEIPDSAIIQAKNSLHIAYEHTSHGSQLITGMNGLPAFKENNGGTEGIYDYNSTFLHDDAMASYGDSAADLGYADWAEATRGYLDDPAHSDCNVIMWSWCGQVGSYDEQGLIDHYLDPMTQLEIDYPDVVFVYMTGHVDGNGLEGSVHIRNEQIRDYCVANNKVLYDFADIESYDPDGEYYGDKHVNDNCDWYNDTHSGNWALDWQATHTEDVEWYDCSPAHTQALNGNMKAYAVWWLWATLGGWEMPEVTESYASVLLPVCVISLLGIISVVKKRK